MPYHSPRLQHLLTPYKLPQPQSQPHSPTHHHKSVVEVAEEEVEAVAEEAVAVEAGAVAEAVEEEVEEDHLVVNLLHKPLHLLRLLTTMAED